ncbi:uncharacterized protein LOC142533785 isoform X3 [Primulina tabacum]|uniref:uncharacterized protein LOC142533785 isoform X3 n=1 Tax=Primulina tabacum TaxID=48773 RepID=UPI003F5998A9
MAYTRFCTSERPRAHQCFCRCPGFTLIFWEDIYGKMPKHMLLRLMDIVGHLMKLRTLKNIFFSNCANTSILVMFYEKMRIVMLVAF